MGKNLAAATRVFVWLVGLAALVFMAWSAKREIARGERETAAADRDKAREARELARDKREADERDASTPREGALLSDANSNAYRAEITATNTSAHEVRYGCAVATVTHKKTGLQAKSLVVCTGPVRPHSSVTLDAPYAAGAVEHLCKDDGGSFTWDVCTFEITKAP